MIIEFRHNMRMLYTLRMATGAITYATKHQDVHLVFRTGPILGPEEPPTVDGVITFHNAPTPPGVPAINPSTRPVPGMPSVSADNDAICEMIVNHFAERNLPTMALLVRDGFQVAPFRMQAFTAACLNRGYRPHLIHATPRSMNTKNRSFVDALKNLSKPAGLMLTEDSDWQWLARVCAEIGIRVPEDLAVVGVNNSAGLDNESDADLSSVDINAEMVGYESVRLLVRLINGETVPERTLIQPRELIARRSSDVRVDLDPDVSKALAFMRTHLNESIELDDVLRSQGLGRRALERHFRQALDETPMSHLRNMRLEMVESLLKTTELTVTEIGRQCGIPDVNYLCRLFKKIYKTTPLTYRKDHLRDQFQSAVKKNHVN